MTTQYVGSANDSVGGFAITQPFAIVYIDADGSWKKEGKALVIYIVPTTHYSVSSPNAQTWSW